MNPQQIDTYLKRKGSPLAGLGKTFASVGAKYHVDPALLVAISGAESSFGKHQSGSHNPFGWGPGIDFPNYDSAIDTVARGLRTGYLDQGRTTIPQIQQKWAPSGATNDPMGLNNFWVKNVSHFFKELGGVKTVKSSRPVASPVPSVSPMTTTTTVTTPGNDPLADAAMETLGYIAKGGSSPSGSLKALTEAAGKPRTEATTQTVSSTQSPKKTFRPYTPQKQNARKKASSYQALSFASGVKITGTNAKLLGSLNALARSLGKRVTVISAWRSAHEQYDLYQDLLAGRRAGPVAPAYRNKDGTYRSTSNHTSGKALDVLLDGTAIGKVVPASVLANYGLKSLASINDPAHIELNH